MKIKFKKLHIDAKLPVHAKPGDAGADLTAISRRLNTGDNSEADYIEYGTGLSVEIPEGYVGLLFPRSSNTKKDLTLGNSVGVIDSGYRGEILLRYKVDANYDDIHLDNNLAFCSFDNDKFGEFYQLIYDVGDKVGQLVIVPYVTIESEFVDDLTKTDRDEGGFGSTGV